MRAGGRSSNDGRVAAAVSEMPDVDTAGLPEELSPVDQILHRGEANPRTRSGIMTVEILDTTPDWQRLRTRFEHASRRVLRLRQKVVMPTLPTVAPRWVIDPDFNLDFHVRRVRAAEPGTLREVLDLAEVALQSPLDISRPLWTATLDRGACRWPRRDDGSSQPRRHRWCRRCRDVRQSLRSRARSPAAGRSAGADSAGPVTQRPDAGRVQPAAGGDRGRRARRACRRRPGGRQSGP